MDFPELDSTSSQDSFPGISPTESSLGWVVMDRHLTQGYGSPGACSPLGLASSNRHSNHTIHRGDIEVMPRSNSTVNTNTTGLLSPPMTETPASPSDPVPLPPPPRPVPTNANHLFLVDQPRSRVRADPAPGPGSGSEIRSLGHAPTPWATIPLEELANYNNGVDVMGRPLNDPNDLVLPPGLLDGSQHIHHRFMPILPSYTNTVPQQSLDHGHTQPSSTLTASQPTATSTSISIPHPNIQEEGPHESWEQVQSLEHFSNVPDNSSLVPDASVAATATAEAIGGRRRKYHKRRSRKDDSDSDSDEAPPRKKLQHKLPKIHKCQVCHKYFDRPSTLKVHQAKHTRSKDFRCPFCNQGFGVNSNMRRHARTCKKNPKPEAPRERPGFPNGKRRPRKQTEEAISESDSEIISNDDSEEILLTSSESDEREYEAGSSVVVGKRKQKKKKKEQDKHKKVRVRRPARKFGALPLPLIAPEPIQPRQAPIQASVPAQPQQKQDTTTLPSLPASTSVPSTSSEPLPSPTPLTASARLALEAQRTGFSLIEPKPIVPNPPQSQSVRVPVDYPPSLLPAPALLPTISSELAGVERSFSFSAEPRIHPSGAIILPPSPRPMSESTPRITDWHMALPGQTIIMAVRDMTEKEKRSQPPSLRGFKIPYDPVAWPIVDDDDDDGEWGGPGNPPLPPLRGIRPQVGTEYNTISGIVEELTPGPVVKIEETHTRVTSTGEESSSSEPIYRNPSSELRQPELIRTYVLPPVLWYPLRTPAPLPPVYPSEGLTWTSFIGLTPTPPDILSRCPLTHVERYVYVSLVPNPLSSLEFPTATFEQIDIYTDPTDPHPAPSPNGPLTAIINPDVVYGTNYPVWGEGADMVNMSDVSQLHCVVRRGMTDRHWSHWNLRGQGRDSRRIIGPDAYGKGWMGFMPGPRLALGL